MIKRILCLGIIGLFLFSSDIRAQVTDDEDQIKARMETPQAIDFSKIFEKKKLTREEFDLLQRQKDLKLQERLLREEALEHALDPTQYRVGPGDVFSFNIWGALEQQIPLTVGPEGKLHVPSIGEVFVDNKTLSEVQDIVLQQAIPVYQNSRITLTLEALRFFRIHIVGEVKYPGTFLARAVNSVSEMIAEAGGVTEWAWKQRIEIRHADSTEQVFDLADFEQEGKGGPVVLVRGGDVIFVPPLALGNDMVKVEGDQEFSGIYQMLPGETALHFLQRIRALRKNTEMSRIRVVRTANGSSKKKKDEISIEPFAGVAVQNDALMLLNGDRIVLPSNYVYVKGAVRVSGAYPYIVNMTARDYAGMAGGDYRSSSIKSVNVYHVWSGKTEKGPEVLVEPGDVVHLNPTFNERFGNYIQIIPVFTSLILAAKAAGFLGD